MIDVNRKKYYCYRRRDVERRGLDINTPGSVDDITYQDREKFTNLNDPDPEREKFYQMDRQLPDNG